MSHIYTIYKATNNVTGKCYIGFDSHWPKRQKDHNCYAFSPTNRCYNFYFERIIRKYGKDVIEWQILYQSHDRDHTLNSMEPHFIKEYNSFGIGGYNSTPGGEGGAGFTNRGRIRSEETKKRISESKIGNIRSEETKRKLSAHFKGRKQKIVMCPHCNKSGGTTMYRWHFNNCKFQ